MKSLLPLLLLFLLVACDKSEPEPAYLLVEGALSTETGEREDALAIMEVWLFVDGTFLGAYDLPARIPVLTTGSAEVELRWGIRQDGRSQVPDIYPFYTPILRTLDLAPGSTTDLGILPVTYSPETNIIINENFEPGIQRVFTDIVRGESGVEVTTEDVYQGQASGKITLSPDNTVVEIASRSTYSGLTDLMRGNVWIEVTFRSDVPVIWGVVGLLPGQGFSRFYDPGFNPSTTWRKIYFNVTAAVGTSLLENYNFALFTSVADAEVMEGNVFLDNIKVLYL